MRPALPAFVENNIHRALESGCSKAEVTEALMMAAYEAAGTQLSWVRETSERVPRRRLGPEAGPAGGGPKVKELSWNDCVELASPHPYALATAVDAHGKANIIGLGWWTIVSWKPPMVAIAVAPERHSYAAIKHSGEFALCLPAEDQARAAWLCGTQSGRKVDKFAEGGLKAVPGRVVRAPLIDGSTVALECRVVDEMRTGDHYLFLAEVVASHGSPEKARHLYSIHYRKLVAIDPKGGVNWDLEYR